MSKKSDFSAELVAASRRLGGSHLTQEARDKALSRFAEYVWGRGFQVASVQHIKLKHIRTYVENRQAAGIGARTIQNEVSHLRRALTAAGRGQFVEEQLGSRQLGLEQASRDGTKVAIDEAAYQAALAEVGRRDEGVAAALELCRELGLRSQEAVMAGPYLAQWKQALEQGRRLAVAAGTKGGRLRFLPSDMITRPERALAALERALRSSEGSGRIVAADTLKSALDRFHNVARMSGLVGVHAPHSLRYGFACDAIDLMTRNGYSSRQAAQITSEALGHGDGRGRWVEQVYSRR